MPPVRPAPPNAIRVATYADLDRWVAGFRAGKFNLLFLIGPPGLGKTRVLRAVLDGCPHLLLEGHATPLSAYARLFAHRDQPVVVDDEDSMHADPQKLRLLRCLCNTEPVKRLAWQSTSKLLDELNLPQSFETTSQVAVVTNHMAAATPQLAALLDRGCVLHFAPSAGEVHLRVADWFTDREVYDFFGRWLRVIAAPSMRQYVKAAEMKAAGLDWEAVLMAQWKASKVWHVEQVQADPPLTTEEERVAKFEELGGGSRATYFRHLGRWRRLG